MPAPTIEELRKSNYMKLLEYAASNIGEPFTAQDAVTATGVSLQVFTGYVDAIYSETSRGSGRYGITIDTVPKYIDFLEFREAKASAESAKTEAKSARVIAIWAILIAAALALTQVYFQINGTTRLDKTQFNTLVEASSSINEAIIKDQSPKLDLLAGKLDKGNETLQKVEQNQIAQMALIKHSNQPGKRPAL